MASYQKIRYKRTRTRYTKKTRRYVKKSDLKNSNFDYLKKNGGKGGNRNHCPTCGAFIGNKGNKGNKKKKNG